MRSPLWLALLPLLVAPGAGADPIQLPDMGASSAATLSPQKEAEVGREVMRQLRHSGSLIEDPFIEEYIEYLGYRLLSVTDTGTRFTFFMLDDPAINAFALPGGYVGINAGLVLASGSENELAGVVAHEIAHVTQSHIARSLEEQNRLNLPMTAAIVAGLVLGHQNPQIGEAAIASALAGSTQARLDFSRLYEQEADRVGIGLLAQAGFDPEGMPRFFEKLYQETRFSGGEAAELEFLRTHPVTVSRIADSRNRAAQYTKQVLETPTSDYEYAKAILRVRTARDPASAIQYFEQALEKGEARNATAARAGLALALLKANRPREALDIITRALDASEPKPLLMRITAPAELAAGKPGKGEARLRRAAALYPDDSGVVFAYARLMLDNKRYSEVVSLISTFLRRHDLPKAYALLAEAETGRGRLAAAHLALAEEYYRYDEIVPAIDQLRIARRDPKADFYTLSRIDARLAELERLLPSRKQENSSGGDSLSSPQISSR